MLTVSRTWKGSSLIPNAPRSTTPDVEILIAQLGGLFCLPEDEHLEQSKKLFETLCVYLDLWVEYTRSNLYEVRPREVTYGILSAFEFNAFAFAVPSGRPLALDFVGINVGIVFTLLDAFLRILAHPASFPDVGDPTAEDETRSTPRPLTTNVRSLRSGLTSPNCQVRNGFALTLMYNAIAYLFFHEITHLRNGHCEYAREHLQKTCWAEVPSRGEIQEPMLRQTLEWDADSGAVLHALNNAVIQQHHFAKAADNLDAHSRSVSEAAYGDIRRTTRTVAYSAYVLFRLFDNAGWDAASQSSSSHPQPAFRMSLLSPHIGQILQTHPEYYEYPTDSLDSDMLEVIAAAEIHCTAVLQGVPPNPSGILNVISNSLLERYQNDLLATWRSIRPYLEKFRRGGKLPD